MVSFAAADTSEDLGILVVSLGEILESDFDGACWLEVEEVGKHLDI